ncbi:MAG: hypothetical protein AB8B70_09110, partial [Prochlorococcus sp.]
MVTQCCSRVLFKSVAQEVVEAVGQNLVMPCPVADFALWPGAQNRLGSARSRSNSRDCQDHTQPHAWL